jgi:hypothetical protein
VVLSRGANPTSGEAQVTADSVPDIGRSLQHARTQAGLSLPEVALEIGVASSELEALESGTVGRMQDRIETLRALRTYADSLGLPGDAYVLTVLDLWPSIDIPARNGDTGVVPVVSVSSAPAGGHSPAGDYGSAFPADSTGVSDSTVTGVMGAVGPLSLNDTRQVPVYETGQVPAIGQSAPRYLKVLVGLVALLVVAAGVGLGLHNQLSSWIHSAKTETNTLINEAKKDSGVSSAGPTSSKGRHAAAAAGPKVTLVNNAGGTSATINVATPVFQVEVLTGTNPSWVQVTNSGSQVPVFSQVIPGGKSQTFPVTQSATIETGNLSAHYLVLEGLKIIGYYVPTKAPFTLTFNSVT